MIQIRIASFNLQNLQLPNKTLYYGQKPYRTEEGTSLEEAYTYKCQWISDNLFRANADVVALQEIWDPKTLDDVLGVNNLQEEYSIISCDAVDSGISVGLIFKNAVFTKVQEETYWIKNLPDELVLRKMEGPRDYSMSIGIDKFSRAVLKTTLLHKELQEKITFYVAHFKSKIPMRFSAEEKEEFEMGEFTQRNAKALSSMRRVAEAAGLRILLDKQMKGTHDSVIVMGDLNDDESSDTLDIVTDTPKYRLSVNSRRGRMSDKGLYTAAAMNDFISRKDVLYSFIHEGRRSMLDHNLFSEQFYDESKNRKWAFESFRVINDFLDDQDPLESDHGIPVITFEH